MVGWLASVPDGSLPGNPRGRSRTQCETAVSSWGVMVMRPIPVSPTPTRRIASSPEIAMRVGEKADTRGDMCAAVQLPEERLAPGSHGASPGVLGRRATTPYRRNGPPAWARPDAASVNLVSLPYQEFRRDRPGSRTSDVVTVWIRQG